MAVKKYISKKKTMKKKNKKRVSSQHNRKVSRTSKKKKYTKKQKRQSGGNPITHIMRQGQFGITRLVDIFRGNTTPIRYSPNVTRQFGHRV